MYTEKKIPTLLAIILIIILVGVISYFVDQSLKTTTVASASIEPKNVMITNATDRTATIIWETESPATGMVILTDAQKKKSSAFDERDVTGKMTPYTTHSVSVKNLTPTTTYDVTILSNGKKYEKGQNQYQFQTGVELTPPLTQLLDPAYGIILFPAGYGAEHALVTLTIEDSQTLSTLVKPSGSWLIPLNLIRSKDLLSYIPYQEKMNETIAVTLGDQKIATLTDTMNDSPVPDMTLGNTYDFRNFQAKKSSTPIASKTSVSQVLGDQTKNTTKNISGISITSPTINAILASPKPLIQGTGIAGKTVAVVIGITKTQTGKTTVGTNGIWQFTPAVSLAAGKQSVTITTTDAKNKPVAITQIFTILKSGTQVLGDATPSAALEPTPTTIVSSTDSATPSPTLTITPTDQPIDETTTLSAEPMPTSGSPLQLILMMMLSVSLMSGGLIFIKK